MKNEELRMKNWQAETEKGFHKILHSSFLILHSSFFILHFLFSLGKEFLEEQQVIVDGVIPIFGCMASGAGDEVVVDFPLQQLPVQFLVDR